MNKIENPRLNDESKIIFNYFKITKLLSRAHLELNFKIYNHLSNFKHDYLFSINLKHTYFIISLHFENRHYFIFTIFEINQIQFTKMQ